MKPIDYRNATFADIQQRLEGTRRIVYDALRTLGPQTTRNLARLAQIDILTVRPRVTELIELGLVELAPTDGARTKEGIYRALSAAEARQVFDTRWQQATKEEQLALI